jgi:hypothetical protein
MTEAEILTEFENGGRLSQVDIDWFHSEGIGGRTLAYAYHGGGSVVGKDRIVFLQNRAFEFKRYLKSRTPPLTAYIFVAADCCGRVSDLIAWHPRTKQIARWLGRVSLLGEEQAFKPHLEEGLFVHADPRSWLRAWRRGIVILEPDGARSILCDAGALVVSSVEQKYELRNILTKTRLPHILIAAPAEETTA